MSRRTSRDEMEDIVAGFDKEVALVLNRIWEYENHLGDQQDYVEEMEDLGEGLRAILARLGLPSIEVLQELREHWNRLAGHHWGSQAAPIVVRHGVLIVEAADRRLVRRLRYDTDSLLNRLQSHFGKTFVSEIEVVSPSAERRW